MMKKINKKLAVALLALTCASCSTVAGVAVDNVAIPSAITANAEAVTYTVNTLTAVASSTSTLIEAYPNDGSGKPAGNWTDKYTLVEGTGAGFCLNGEKLASGSIKQPNDFYIELGVEAKSGDVVTIDGTFYNANTSTSFVFKNCGLQFDGTKWNIYVSPVAPTQYEIGELTLHVNSVVGGAKGNNAVLYLQREDGEAFPILSWDYAFVAKNADCFKVNGVAKNFGVMKSTGDGMYFEFDALSAGDVITIGGVYYCEDQGVEYAITESSFKWNGTGWEIYKSSEEPEVPVDPEEPEVDYDDTVLGQVFVSDGNSKSAYFKPVDDTVSLPVNSWDYAFSYVSGNGITVNGVMISMTNSVKSVGGKLFADLGAEAKVGDILKIGGVFRCDEAQVDYVVEDREFEWNGSTWAVYGEEIVYDEYNLGVVTLNWPSEAKENAQNGQLYLNQESGEALPIQNWDIKFTHESGDGIKVNGQVKTLAEIKSTELGLFLGFAGVNAGDVVTISGTFVLDSENTRYTVEESKFVWNGTTWEKYVVYTTYNVGNVIIGMESTASAMYFATEAGKDFDAPTGWDAKFAFVAGSGVGVTINGKQIDMSDIKVPGTMYVNLKTTAVAGDVLVIGGTFYNVENAVKYVIEETKFVFDGASWLDELTATKRDAKAALDEYKASFAEEDYYADEWASFDTIIEAGKTKIDSATNADEVAAALADAKKSMDDIVTKAEADAIFEGLKDTAAADLAAYKAEADYRAAEWAQIQTIIQTATAEIKAAESVTAINTAVNTAKEAIDALKTKAQWEADEAAVAAAKADLAEYKAEADYREAEWTAMQAIITEANTAIDGAIGNQEGIDAIVASAKEEMDAIKTAAQLEAEEGVVLAAKAELDAYVAETDYKAAEWTAIQAIIAEAKTAIDGAIGDEAAISGIVAAAKTAIDEVKTAEEMDAAALAAAKEEAKAEVRAYYNAIDHDKYSEEAEITLSGFVAAAISAIDEATAIADVEAVVTQFKTNVDGVEQIQESNSGSDSEKTSSGCGSVVGGVATAAMAAAVAVALLRKKKED